MSLYNAVVLLFMKHQSHEDTRGNRGLATRTPKPGNAWKRLTSLTLVAWAQQSGWTSWRGEKSLPCWESKAESFSLVVSEATIQ